MKKMLIILLALSVIFPGATQSNFRVNEIKASEKRVALIIGNGNYEESPLKNPVNDARDMAQVLRRLNFEVMLKENLTQNDMKRAIRDFGAQIRNVGIALFYYAGHGAQVKGQNYLIPLKAIINSEEEVEFESVDLGYVLAQMENAKSRTNLAILDACRNNPFIENHQSSLTRRPA